MSDYENTVWASILPDLVKYALVAAITSVFYHMITKKHSFTPATYNKHMLSQRICTIPSHTFNEYLIMPDYTSTDCIEANVSLKTPLAKFSSKLNQPSPLTINTPMVSACMQSVSGEDMGVALAQ